MDQNRMAHTHLQTLLEHEDSGREGTIGHKLHQRDELIVRVVVQVLVSGR
jgi:hypothetical protein